MSQVAVTQSIHDGVVLPHRRTGVVPLYVMVHLEETDSHSARTFFEPLKTFEANDKANLKAQAEHRQKNKRELDPADYHSYFQPYHRVGKTEYYLCVDLTSKDSAYLPFEGQDKMFKNLSEYEAYVNGLRTAASQVPETQPETKELKPETPQPASKRGGESK